MGLSSSCNNFEALSSAILWILKNRFDITDVVKVLNDFLFLALTYSECKRYLVVFLKLANILNIPIALDKTSVEPTQSLTFLGIFLDSIKMLAQLPIDKLVSCSESIENFLLQDKFQLRELHSIIDKLQFATTVVKGDKAFLRRMYDLTVHTAKSYYKVCINNEVKSDLMMWLSFLKSYNGRTLMYQPPIIESNSINLYTDASRLGFGGTFGSSWVQGVWPEDWSGLNIGVLELYPILLLLQMFGQKMANSDLLVDCDNMGIVEVINKQTSRSRQIMTLLRPLILILLKFNIRFRCQHLMSAENNIAEAISRFQENAAFLRGAGLNLNRLDIPSQMLPDNYRM